MIEEASNAISRKYFRRLEALSVHFLPCDLTKTCTKINVKIFADVRIVLILSPHIKMLHRSREFCFKFLYFNDSHVSFESHCSSRVLVYNSMAYGTWRFSTAFIGLSNKPYPEPN